MLCALRRVLVAASLLLLAGSAAAQDTTLSNTWFKLKVKVKGEAAVPGEEKPHKASFSATAYLHLVLSKSASATEGELPTYPTTQYNYELWMQTGPDTWMPVYGSTIDLETAHETVFYLSDFYLEFVGPNGEYAESYQTAVIRAKLDAEGGLKSATIKTFGGEVYGGTEDGTDALRGGVTSNGKTIDADKLPFGLG